MAKLTIDYVKDKVDDVRNWRQIDRQSYDDGGYKALFVNVDSGKIFKIVCGNEAKRTRHTSHIKGGVEESLGFYNSIYEYDMSNEEETGAGSIINVGG